MPDTKKYKSVAVTIPTWERLWEMANKNHRSPAQQISFLVESAQNAPSDSEVTGLYAGIKMADENERG